MRKLAASILTVCTVASAHAATIESRGRIEGLNVVLLSGLIEHGDSDKFDAVIHPLSGKTVVILQGPGGKLVDALNIGTTIRQQHFATAVPEDTMCASACGYIWLSGTPRYLTDGSHIGFHAAYHEDDGTESSAGNALVGAYLSKLGLSYNAIAFLTASPPQGMRWLHPDEADRYGITYAMFGERSPESHSQALQTIPDPPAPVFSPAEQQAKQLVTAYHADWSQAGTSVERMARYYAPQVSFYGMSLSRQFVIEQMRQFATRWPVRQYRVVPQTMSVQCSTNDCTVNSVVSWDYSNPDGVRSIGAARLTFRIVDGLIVSENSRVLSNRTDSVATGPTRSR